MPEQFAHHLSIGFSAPAGLAASVRAVSVMTVRSRSPWCKPGMRPASHEIAPHADLRFAARLNCAETQHVTHFFLFGPQIGNGVRIGLSFAGQPRTTFDAVFRQRDGFARIVRQQANSLDAKIVQDRGR